MFGVHFPAKSDSQPLPLLPWAKPFLGNGNERPSQPNLRHKKTGVVGQGSGGAPDTGWPRACPGTHDPNLHATDVELCA